MGVLRMASRLAEPLWSIFTVEEFHLKMRGKVREGSFIHMADLQAIQVEATRMSLGPKENLAAEGKNNSRSD
jgi:hypothetical protein